MSVAGGGMGTSGLGAVLSEARSLVTRLHERDRLADGLLNASQAMHEKINCMREYQEDLHELHDMVHQKPRTVLIHSLQQENRQIRLLQEENRQLRTTLQEYEAGLELIMGQHRAQMAKLRRFAALQTAVRDAYERLEPSEASVSEAAQSREFAALFSDCLRTGQDSSLADAEELARLRTENHTLRDLLTISTSNDPDALKRFKQTVAFDGKDGETKDGERTPRAGNSSPVRQPPPPPGNPPLDVPTEPASTSASVTNGEPELKSETTKAAKGKPGKETTTPVANGGVPKNSAAPPKRRSAAQLSTNGPKAAENGSAVKSIGKKLLASSDKAAKPALVSS